MQIHHSKFVVFVVVSSLACALTTHGQIAPTTILIGDSAKSVNVYGTVLSEGPILEGKRHGTWTLYYPSGRFMKTVEYREGRMVDIGDWWTHNDEYKDSCHHQINEDYTGTVECYEYGRISDKTTITLDKKKRLVKKVETINRFGKVTATTHYDHKGRIMK